METTTESGGQSAGQTVLEVVVGALAGVCTDGLPSCTGPGFRQKPGRFPTERYYFQIMSAYLGSSVGSLW